MSNSLAFEHAVDVDAHELAQRPDPKWQWLVDRPVREPEPMPER